jgi:hypothetical protein
MQHFEAKDLDRIRDVEPNTWATVRADDAMTISALTRRGFHLVDMSGELWVMRLAS